MFAHLLDSYGFHTFTFKCKNKPEIAGEFNCPLAFSVAFQFVTAEAWQLLEFFDIFCMFNDIDLLDEFPSNDFTVRLFCFPMMCIAFFEFTCAEPDFHDLVLLNIYLLGKIL